jgi:orotate phosphoribosyltransferase
MQTVRALERFGARAIVTVASVDREEEKNSEFIAKKINLITATRLSELQNFIRQHRRQSEKPTDQSTEQRLV